MMRILTLFMVVIFCRAAYAGEISISSLTENIFLCNAGLRHSGSGSLCHDPSTGEVCKPEVDSSCVCHSISPIGDYVSGFVENNSAGHSRDVPAGASAYRSLVPSGQEFLGTLRNVNFGLGSEVYGADYFVQFCYRGPAKDLKKEGENIVDKSLGRYMFKMTFMGKDKKYNEKIASVKLRYWCEGRRTGESSIVPLAVSPAVEISIPFSSSALSQQVGPFYLNYNPTEVPGMCIFQIYLSEVKNVVRRSGESGGHFEGLMSIFKVTEH